MERTDHMEAGKITDTGSNSELIEALGCERKDSESKTGNDE